MADGRAKTDTRVVSKKTSGAQQQILRLKLLGGFEVSVGDRTVEQGAWRLRKAAALVKMLALSPGHRLHREQAMTLLWPDLGRKAGSNNLRQALHAARRALDPAAGPRYLVSEEESLVLCPGSDLWVDVEVFEDAAGRARRSPDPAAYEAALDLYAGELLPEDRYEEWAEGPRRRLQEAYLSLLFTLARLREEHDDLDAAAEVWRRAVAEEPVREEAHVGLMRAHALEGDRAAALAQFVALEKGLLRELGTEPSASSRALRDDIASGTFDPHKTRHGKIPPDELVSDHHNLSAARTSFVGREREMLEVKRALAMTRLLTLIGAGGSGKTRLALEVARELVAVYRDGVWLVELASLSDPQLLAQEVAETLGVQESTDRPLRDALVHVLRGKEMLLVLDNCEHVVEEAAKLASDLLDSCPSLRIMATSREALSVAGEVRWVVPTLSVPDSRRSHTVGELVGSEAVRLFAERASDGRPGFALVPENARTVAEICRRLDGVPLAIELAAARVTALSVAQICERLDDSLGLLTGGGRTRTARQQTLRATMDWSHELLDKPERAVFRRLSVFAGGWALGAAEAVSVGREVEEGDVLDLLSALVDRSLVVAEATEDGGMRYGMLEPVRQYALEKLGESGEAERVRRRHVECFLALAQEAAPELWGPTQEVWLERLEPEHDNMRAALSWTLARGDTEPGLRLAGALWPFWYARGHYAEGRRWLEEALSAGALASPAARARALEGLSWLANEQGDTDKAEAAAEEGLKLCAEAGVGGNLAASLRGLLGDVAKTRGDFELAEQLFEECLGLYREAGNKAGVTWGIGGLGTYPSTVGTGGRPGSSTRRASPCLGSWAEDRWSALS